MPLYPPPPVGVLGANPSASVGLSAVNGVAVTYMRSDGAPALDPSIAPTWTGLHTFTPSTAGTAVTINPATSQNALDISSNTFSVVNLTTYNDTNTFGSNDNEILWNRYRGTKASPTAVASGTSIGAFFFGGYDGTAVRYRGAFGALVDGAVSSTVVPIALTFFTGTTARLERLRITSSGNFQFNSAASIGWTSTGDSSGTVDLFQIRAGAATLQLGAANAASPVAQTLQVQSPRGGTDTDTAGPDYTFNASQSTGTGAGGNIVEQTTPSAKSTSSAANTLVKRRVVNAKGKVLTSAAAASLVDITMPTLAMAGGSIRATIICTNGTDMQSYSQVITFAAVNKGGAYTTTITADAGNDAKAVSAGTLTTAWSILNGTNKVTIQLTATTSLTPSTNAFLFYYQIEKKSEQAITIL